MSNHLVNESSPYLLQHAHNPVDWYPWTDEAWEKAKKEDKLVLVSIGYSSCHWCHVMERESFENEATARLMNEHYVCIKVDREERPDVDQVYMSAVQLMTGSGGWPLNCFCLPDGRPIYGGTYYPNATWNDVLVKLNTFYKENKEKANQYADELTQGINQMESFHLKSGEAKFHLDEVKKIVETWRKHFDLVEGGPNRAPKFPMPNNYEFLLHYYYVTKDESILNYVLLTLDKMAFGGIYDQIGGGFARYSTDAFWKAPHFEKMLYDNAQLVSLYSHAYQLTKKQLYKDVVYETLEFIRREMTNEAGGFHSALDADSEGVEGKYYVWKLEEIEQMAGRVSPEIEGIALKVFKEYFSVNEKGLWEGSYILLRKKTDEEIAKEFKLSVDILQKYISAIKRHFFIEREKRIRPGLDDKQLTSWNALMIKAYCDAYNAFGEDKFLKSAEVCANHILFRARSAEGMLLHNYKNGKASIDGYLEDYSFMIEGLIALYQCTFSEGWLTEARRLADYTIENFYDAANGMFWFTSNKSPALISRKKEIADNVIPASNSSMAKCLFYLGKYYGENKYSEIASQMLSNVKDAMASYASSYSNWAILMLYLTSPMHEVVIAGPGAGKKRKEFAANYFPNAILAGDIYEEATLPLLEQRYTEGKTLIYVCENNTCKLPVEDVNQAILFME
jgi:uncharacterized protein YyaL (SSP411 family)